MTMQAAFYGRIGKDPESRTTRNGNEMPFTSVAVDVTPFGTNTDQRETLWLNVTAFGRVAGDLMRLQKGDLASMSGKVGKSRWTGKDGVEHEQLQVTADSVISARTARPGGGRKKSSAQQNNGAQYSGSQRMQSRSDFNDDASFRVVAEHGQDTEQTARASGARPGA